MCSWRHGSGDHYRTHVVNKPKGAAIRGSIRYLFLAATFGLVHGLAVQAAQDAVHKDQTAAAPAADQFRTNYFPNTEVLGADEMRVIALGTGTPNFRHSQASASWLVELGNDQKFIFDIGTGSLRVWGPSGLKPEYGTKYAVDRMREMLMWDIASRRGNMPSAGGHVEVTEFDYSSSQAIYEEDGVTIRAWPAIHGIDGSVSYSLEWKGKKFVYSGDTTPNKWFVSEARDADLLIHECYLSVEQFIELKSYDGALTLADDLLVWNITTDQITTRRVIGTDEPLPATPPGPAGPPDPSERTKLSDWLEAGRLDLSR